MPENAVLVIAGDIDTDHTRKLVLDYFGEIARGGHEIYRPDIEEPPQEKEVRKTIYDNIQLPGLFMAYHSPALGDPDYYAFEMLQTLLAGGQSSRFYKSIVDGQQLALDASSMPLALEDDGLFLVYGIANMGISLEDLESAIDAEIESVKSHGLDTREFEKLVNQTENDFISQNTTMAGIASSLADYYTFFRNPGLINNEIEEFLTVTAEDIVTAAKKYLVPENRVVLYYLPKEQETN